MRLQNDGHGILSSLSRSGFASSHVADLPTFNTMLKALSAAGRTAGTGARKVISGCLQSRLSRKTAPMFRNQEALRW